MSRFYLENEAMKLFRAYARRYASYKGIKLPAKNIKQHKWWKYFQQIAEYHSKKQYWNAEKFIQFCFDHYGLLYPPQLKNQNIWKAFEEHMQRGDLDRNHDTEIAKDLLNTYNQIRKWSKKNNKSEVDVRGFFTDTRNLLFVKRGSLSPYFLAICRPFREWYEQLTEKEKNDIFSEKELNIKRKMVYRNKKLWNKMEEVLGKELY